MLFESTTPIAEPDLKSCALDRSANLAVINNIIYKEQTLKLNLTTLCELSRDKNDAGRSVL